MNAGCATESGRGGEADGGGGDLLHSSNDACAEEVAEALECSSTCSLLLPELSSNSSSYVCLRAEGERGEFAAFDCGCRGGCPADFVLLCAERDWPEREAESMGEADSSAPTPAAADEEASRVRGECT